MRVVWTTFVLTLSWISSATAMAALPSRLAVPLPPAPQPAKSVTTIDPSGDPAVVLKEHDIEPDTASVLEFLRQWQPDAGTRARIAALIGELGGGSFPAREEASRKLASLGAATVAPLKAAAGGDDPEVAARARRLLAEWDRGDRRRENEDLLPFALRWLCRSPTAGTTDVLLDILPALPPGRATDAATQAIWTCATPADAKRLRKSVDAENPFVRSAAIPALERVTTDGAVSVLQKFLGDKEERVRLAAARALIDRLPKPAVAVLLGLLSSDDPAVRVGAAWLLWQVSGLPANPANADFAKKTRDWKAWAAGPLVDHPRAVGHRRLEPPGGAAVLDESFADDSADASHGYHLLQYETTVPGALVSVKEHILRFDGHHAEGDQRLYVTPDALIGLPAFPSRFQIRVTLGGENAGAGTWHAGVSVGNVRVLFHPAFERGGFRAECVGNHKFLFDNQNMPFTPAPGKLYPMTIDVERRAGGTVDFTVAISDPGGKTYVKAFTADAPDAGDLRRIGLERSGRIGGAALFGPVTIGNVSSADK